jgi:hypothetical protein
MSKICRKASIFPALAAILLLGGLLLTSGCDLLLPAATLAPTETPTQTHTPTPTVDWFPATPTPTFLPTTSPTPQITLADQYEGVADLSLQDNFTDERLWTTPQTESGNVAFGNENLTLAVAKQDTYLFSNSQHTLNNNFYLEITIQTSLCQPEDQFGIIFWRQSESDYYQLSFDCSGQYRLILVQAGQSVVLRNWESASQMLPGYPAENRVGLWVRQGLFRLYINDTFQFEETISRERTGDLSVFARTVAGDAITVRFSDLKIFRIDNSF